MLDIFRHVKNYNSNVTINCYIDNRFNIEIEFI